MTKMTKSQKTNLIIFTFIFAFLIVITTKAYERPFIAEETHNKQFIKENKPSSQEIREMITELEEENKIASWYDYELSGKIWSETHRTAASRKLTRYSTARVTNLDNGKSIEVYINDYGPKSCEDRIKIGIDTKENCVERDIDLSSFAFSQIADLKLGLVNVKIEQL